MSEAWVLVCVEDESYVPVGRLGLFLPMCKFVGQLSILLRSRLGFAVGIGDAIVCDGNCRFRFQSVSQEILNATSWTLR